MGRVQVEFLDISIRLALSQGGSDCQEEPKVGGFSVAIRERHGSPAGSGWLTFTAGLRGINYRC